MTTRVSFYSRYQKGLQLYSPQTYNKKLIRDIRKKNTIAIYIHIKCI